MLGLQVLLAYPINAFLTEGTQSMSSGLTENDMRRALGLDVAPLSPSSPVAATRIAQPAPRSAAKAKARTPKLRVVLRVSHEFEGATTLVTHETDTLSRFDAEQQARRLAKQAKYRFFELVSITSIE